MKKCHTVFVASTKGRKMKKEKESLIPIVKWAGGKRQLLKDIIPLVPETFTDYVEPFIGGGAVIFNIRPRKATINDLNKELMNVYKVVKQNPNKLVSALEIHSLLNSREYFYKVRSQDRSETYDKMTDIEKAARTIYLNRTCFNGLFRVNRAGQFNSPYGRYSNPKIVDISALSAMSKYFNDNDIKMTSLDYREVLKGLEKGAFVYLDPPYMPVTSSSCFTGYTEAGFDRRQQIRLAEECSKLNDAGIRFLLSNSGHPFIRELYKDYEIITVKARRSINAISDRRGEVDEVLIRNYD